MSVDERRRSALFQAAAQALGEDHAVTMFELLPPPETDLATRADLELLEERITARLDRMDARIDGLAPPLHARIDGVESSLHARIDQVEASLHARSDGVESSLHTRIDQVEASLHTRIDHLEAALQTEMALLREELLSAFRGELVTAISGQTRGIVVAIMAAIIAAVIGIGGLAVTLSQLL